MAPLKHELWEDPAGLETFRHAGPDGAAARADLPPGSRVVWTVEGRSHFEAMTKYHEHMDWGLYASAHPGDREPYPDDWLARQAGA